MTKQEWLNGTDPDPMLHHLHESKENRSKGGRRKLPLFVCGCGYRVIRLMSERGRRWLQLGEQYADDLLDREQRRQAGMEFIRSLDDMEFIRSLDEWRIENEADLAALFTLESNLMVAAGASAHSAARAIGIEALHQGGDDLKAYVEERREQAQLLRDLLGNRFRPVSTNPSCLTPAVVQLAQAIYDDRAFERRPGNGGVVRLTLCKGFRRRRAIRIDIDRQHASVGVGGQ